ncbi:phage tail tube assembly chaperone [Lactobacillus amylolyticus]|uniref:phage tail tube assembly chaperone n=1 Tax=Lactobacillus amylolyticus TaxID=83683 RepID=UPI002490FE12|nr:phage tail tube assembly chaperone [Lactobacillus amylolyticus]
MLKIRANELGIKTPISIKGSVKATDMADEMLIKLLEFGTEAQKTDFSNIDDDIEGAEKVVALKKKQREFRKEAFDFLQRVLKLTDKQADDAQENIESDEALTQYLNYVIARLNGRTDRQIELDNKKQVDADPKK